VEVAVLPLEDVELFRDERAAIRVAMMQTLVRLAPNYHLVPLAEVDAKLRPVNKLGKRCAFEGEPRRRLADELGWSSTETMVVHGPKPEPTELWIRVQQRNEVRDTFIGPWSYPQPLAQRYLAAFAAMRRDDGNLGLLGGLAARGGDDKEARSGSVRLCELADAFHDCSELSSSWSDRLDSIPACFADTDHGVHRLLVDGTTSPARCEMANLHDTEGPLGQRETCLCTALVASSGVRAKAGRRRIRIEHRATDLQDRTRPELRVLDATTNLHAEDDWHQGVRRLVVDNLDALAYPLARCRASAGTVISADLEVTPGGRVSSSRVTSGSVNQALTTCVGDALGGGAFTCTSNDEPAKLRLAITWPKPSS
jgi:hypothetical protein